jgi:hypothetical protein
MSAVVGWLRNGPSRSMTRLFFDPGWAGLYVRNLIKYEEK